MATLLEEIRETGINLETLDFIFGDIYQKGKFEWVNYGGLLSGEEMKTFKRYFLGKKILTKDRNGVNMTSFAGFYAEYQRERLE